MTRTLIYLMENLLKTDTKNKNVVFFCNYFRKKGFNVKFLTTINEENKDIKKFANNVDVIHFSNKPAIKGGTKKLLFPLSYLIKQKDNYDLIWCYLDRPSSFYSAMAKRLFGKGLMVKCDMSYPTKNKNWFKRIWKYFTVNFPLKNADFILAESKDIYDEVLKIKPKGKIEIIPNGVPVNDFKMADKRLSKVKKENIVLCVGRVEPFKGTKELIIAFKDFYLKNKNWKLKIVGPTNNLDYKKELDKIVSKLYPKDEKAVTFTGPKFGDDLFKSMKEAKIFCAVSLKRQYGDSFNNALPQAMFFGATPIISDAGRLWTQVEGLGVKQINPEDPKELTDALENTRKNPINPLVLKKHIENRFNWDKNLNKIRIPK